MAILIEILETGEGDVRAAFYYQVPKAVYHPASVKPQWKPSGARVTGQQLQAIRDGRGHEYIATVQRTDADTVQTIQAKLEAAYATSEAAAMADYTAQYGTEPLAWDGSNWT